jgi:hypothetical protein
MYRAYYSGGNLGSVPPLEKDRWPYQAFDNLDEALLWTRAVVKRGTTVMSIEGDNGTQLSRGEIAAYMRQMLPADSS